MVRKTIITMTDEALEIVLNPIKTDVNKILKKHDLQLNHAESTGSY